MRITTQTEVVEANAAVELAREELKRYQQLGNTGAIAVIQIKDLRTIQIKHHMYDGIRSFYPDTILVVQQARSRPFPNRTFKYVCSLLSII